MDKNSGLIKKAYDRIEETKEFVNSDYHRLKYHVDASSRIFK